MNRKRDFVALATSSLGKAGKREEISIDWVYRQKKMYMNHLIA